ncbi:hypothetical protein M409DRAFT_70796 [Zasmidium cellare ATCC 36951]|uniref:Rhodopsin domain-containing protein n=1 Tax=Zasmidium cellare ATCC 36951 TaxID=1080233 RepID=A0A6A6C0P7_ZASCE|nr:uncharacterized protein M409DRAFT_70796 [Zasmidium cellare ATCC 36951]KAF2159730.1 hypothetical protein M409DRAFT_70796 [Zasmidium cellare ATCC 36951]
MAVTPAGRGPQVMGVFLLFLGLSSIATVLRIYCRVSLLKSFRSEDWLAVLAWAFFVCHAAFAINGVFHGTGQHFADIHPQSEIVLGLKWWWLCEPLYVLSNMAIKASIAIMLLRLMVATWHRIVIYAVLIVTELFSTAFFFLFIFQCTPSSYFWMRLAGAKGSCLNTSVIVNGVYAYSSILCVGDWIFSFLPFWIVWKLELVSKKEKVMVGIILAMSAIASIATIARIPYIHTLSDQADFLYATADVAIWSCCETGLAITACSSATLRPLFRHLLDRTRLSSSRTSRGLADFPPASPMPNGSRHTRLDSEEPVQLSYIHHTSKSDHTTDFESGETLEKGHAHGRYDR